MNKPGILLALASFLLIAVACTSGEPGVKVVDTSREAQVFSIEAKAGFDLTEEEVEIVLRGTFKHTCARISRVNQELTGNTITMDVETDRTGKDRCETRTGTTAEFIHVVPIDAEALRPGRYIVKLGNLTTGFEVE